MEKTLLELIGRTDSKSTDKLILLLNSIKDIPEEKIRQTKSVELRWMVLKDVVVPEVKVIFS